jgi:hypothetical protein
MMSPFFGFLERLLLHLRLGITGGRQFRSFMGAVYRHHVHPMVLRPVMASTSGCGGWIISGAISALTVGTA